MLCMLIEIEPNPNCPKDGLFVFNEMENPRPVLELKLTKNGREITAGVAGVDADGKFVQAFARKIEDSGAGIGYLIYGGAWGIRLKPGERRNEPWDLKNTHQWGEAYLVYADEEGLTFGEGA